MNRTYSIDTSHSHLGFSVRHLVIAKVRGEFATWNGTIQLDDDDVTRSSVSVEVELASVDTKEAKRDAHLRSADFFDVDNHPKMTFVSTKVGAEDGKVVSLTGDLTIRGITKSVTFAVEDEGRAKDPWGGERAAWSGKARISRHDFGLTWNLALETGGVVVGDNVDIQLDIEAIAAAAAKAA